MKILHNGDIADDILATLIRACCWDYRTGICYDCYGLLAVWYSLLLDYWTARCLWEKREQSQVEVYARGMFYWDHCLLILHVCCSALLWLSFCPLLHPLSSLLLSFLLEIFYGHSLFFMSFDGNNIEPAMGPFSLPFDLLFLGYYWMHNKRKVSKRQSEKLMRVARVCHPVPSSPSLFHPFFFHRRPH